MSNNIGLDIGSRTIKLVMLEKNKNIILKRTANNSHDPLSVCKEMIRDLDQGRIVATGYGRHLIKEYISCETVSEIKAFAVGAKALHGSCRTILDIGGQDTKAISLDENGKILKFSMNDKCAAGTGRFLEIMAIALGLRLKDFIAAAMSSEKALAISSMCTVFAESEVVSMIARGASRPQIARGIHQSIATRSVSLLEKVTVAETVLFAGGVALNPCMRVELEKCLGKSVHVPDEPQLVGALGCSLIAETL